MSSTAAAGTIDHHHDPTHVDRHPEQEAPHVGVPGLGLHVLRLPDLDAPDLPAAPAPGHARTARDVFSIELTSFSTFILLMSSLMMALAVNAIQKGNLKSMRWSLLDDDLLRLHLPRLPGLRVQELRLREAPDDHQQHPRARPSSRSPGTHGLHVLIGVIWLTGMLIYSFTGRLTEKDAIDVESMGLYWHFVDIVWIVIFTAVYLLEYI